ncbi:MAG: BatD family protein, partial [Gemmatimonadota bacterium]
MTALLLLVAALIGQDPVRVQATLADEEIQAGETTVLRVDVATDGERAQIDRFRSLPPGLEVQGTRDFDQRQFSLPGGTRRFISREYVLRALAPGRYRIPALEVVVGGDAYSTTSLLLTVTAAPARAGGEIGGAESEGVVLRAWLDADTVFVGEQVTMEAEAMFSQDARLRLRRAPEYEPPSPSGFWVHDLPASRRPVTRMVEDNVYEVQRFRRAFFPLSPGDFEIPSARLEYEMRQGLLHAPETRELRSDPLPLVVVPVPGPPPPGFTGAVGRYMARGWLEPAEVPTGEAAVLTVEVEGEGNVKALPPPVLPELPDIDVFPPSEEADVATRPTGLGGTKRFSWVLIPRRAGEHEIPAIRYAYFDPDRGGFETVAVGPMALEVTGAAGATSADRPDEPTIRYLATSPEPGDPLAWVRSRWFAAAQLVPLLFLLGALGWTARARRGQPSLRELRRRRRTGLQELEGRAATADPELFADAESFARRWLGDRLAIGPRDRWSSAVGQAAGLTAKTTAAPSRSRGATNCS